MSEEKDLKEDNVDSQESTETPDDNDQSSKDENVDSQESTETVEELKEQLAKAESDRDNYRKGMLSAKAKDRMLVPKENVSAQPKVEQEEVDISEEKVLTVIYRQNEKQILRDVINPDSSFYLSELVDDSQYNEIVGYLPRNIDRSTPQGIHRGLKAAIAAWKEDNGIVTKKSRDKSAQVDLAATKGTSTGEIVKQGRTRKKILSKPKTVKEWY